MTQPPSKYWENHARIPVTSDNEHVLAKELAVQLEQLGLSKSEIGKRVGVSIRSIRRLMNGETIYTRLNFADRLCTEFGLVLPNSIKKTRVYSANQTYCSRCGIPVDERNPSCATCASRHYSRRTTGNRPAILYKKQRRRKRKRKSRAKTKWVKPVFAPLPKTAEKRKTCSRCGVVFNKFTRGCETCGQRRRYRLKKKLHDYRNSN